MGELMEFVVSPHVTFCNFRTGFSVLFLAVLRFSKVLVLFPFNFHSSILNFWALLGLTSIQSIHPAVFSSPCLRALAIHRDSVDPEEERTLPSSSQCRAGTVHVQMRFRICQFFKAAGTLTAGRLSCGHGHPDMGRASCTGHWGHSPNHPAVQSLVHEQLWPQGSTFQQGKMLERTG